MTWAKRLKRVFTKSRRLQAILRSKLAISAVLTSGSLPVLKTRQSFRKYSLTWMTMQVLQQQHGCRIAGLRRAYRWVYSTEEINSIMALTYCPYFGNGMADLVPGVRLGVKYRYIQLELRSECSKLIKLCSNLAEDLI